jgi:hypothetical protein
LEPVGATAEDVLRTVAWSRLAASSIRHHETGWLPEAPGLAQAGLHGGADRLGTVFLPARDAAVDAPYVNPRAAVGKRRSEDPWDRFVKEVTWNLDKAGLGGSSNG